MPLLEVNTFLIPKNVHSRKREVVESPPALGTPSRVPPSPSSEVSFDLDCDKLCREISRLIGRTVAPSVGVVFEGAIAVTNNITLKEYIEIIDHGVCQYQLELRDGVLTALLWPQTPVTRVTGVYSDTSLAPTASVHAVTGIKQEDDEYFYALNGGFVNLGTDPATGKDNAKIPDGGLAAMRRHVPKEGAATTVAIEIANSESFSKLKDDMRRLLGPQSNVMIFLGVNLPYPKYGNHPDNKFQILYGEREVRSPSISEKILRRRREFQREFNFEKEEEMRKCRPEDKADFPLWPVVVLSRFHLFNGVHPEDMPSDEIKFTFDVTVLVKKLHRAWNAHRSRRDSFWGKANFDFVDQTDSPTKVQAELEKSYQALLESGKKQPRPPTGPSGWEAAPLLEADCSIAFIDQVDVVKEVPAVVKVTSPVSCRTRSRSQKRQKVSLE